MRDLTLIKLLLKKKQWITLLLFALGLYSCSKGENITEEQTLKVYSINNVSNSRVQNIKCGVDLDNGLAYTITEGSAIPEQIDIAYGYLPDGQKYERHILNVSYAGCLCNGASYFSYGESLTPKQGYSTYSVKNNTKIWMATENIDFDGIASAKTKSALDKYFPIAAYVDYTSAKLTTDDNLSLYPYVFFETVTGKRGIIRISNFVKNISLNNQLQPNPIDIDVIIEK